MYIFITMIRRRYVRIRKYNVAYAVQGSRVCGAACRTNRTAVGALRSALCALPSLTFVCVPLTH